jgi:hypothetical protein
LGNVVEYRDQSETFTDLKTGVQEVDFLAFGPENLNVFAYITLDTFQILKRGAILRSSDFSYRLLPFKRH